MNYFKKFQRKSRGVSPVIATVLLIGLVVVAGIGVAIVMFGTFTAPTPLKIDIISISEFKTTDDDIYIDQFEVTIQNIERSNVRIFSDSFTLSWFNLTTIEGWTLNLDVNEIILPALSIQTFPISCEPENNPSELTPQNDTIYLEVTIYPEGSDNPRSAKKFKSEILKIGDTYGPVTISPPIDPTLPVGGLNVPITIQNYGSLDLELKLEFTTDSSSKIYFELDNVNTSSYFFSLLKFENTNFPSANFTIRPTSQVAVSENYLVLLFLWNTVDNRLLATANFILTYEG
ncbi:archaellin/type IV pilin N-terminal domain-containing protein [Candidatus Hodarchaeum mangrovi]